MSLMPPPHPAAVLRVLKQAAREYWASGNAQTLSINTPAGQAHTAPLPVTGGLALDNSVPRPVPVLVSINQGTVTVSQTVPADAITGAWSATFAANALAAGAATAAADTDYGVPTLSNTFTLT